MNLQTPPIDWTIFLRGVPIQAFIPYIIYNRLIWFIVEEETEERLPGGVQKDSAIGARGC